MLFPRVGFRNDEQEGLGKTGCTKVITVGWVSLGSPSGNSWPLLQENQMAKDDSLGSVSWDCTDVVVRRMRNGKWKRQSTVTLTIQKLSWVFLLLFSWGYYAPWTSVHRCCCSLSRVVFNISWKPHYDLGTGWCDQGRFGLCQDTLAIQVIKISVWVFFFFFFQFVSVVL